MPVFPRAGNGPRRSGGDPLPCAKKLRAASSTRLIGGLRSCGGRARSRSQTSMTGAASATSRRSRRRPNLVRPLAAKVAAAPVSPRQRAFTDTATAAEGRAGLQGTPVPGRKGERSAYARSGRMGEPPDQNCSEAIARQKPQVRGSSCRRICSSRRACSRTSFRVAGFAILRFRLSVVWPSKGRSAIQRRRINPIIDCLVILAFAPAGASPSTRGQRNDRSRGRCDRTRIPLGVHKPGKAACPLPTQPSRQERWQLPLISGCPSRRGDRVKTGFGVPVRSCDSARGAACAHTRRAAWTGTGAKGRHHPLRTVGQDQKAHLGRLVSQPAHPEVHRPHPTSGSPEPRSRGQGYPVPPLAAMALPDCAVPM
jgi:hypothetical protein